jgi:hypothetical protein
MLGMSFGGWTCISQQLHSHLPCRKGTLQAINETIARCPHIFTMEELNKTDDDGYSSTLLVITADERSAGSGAHADKTRVLLVSKQQCGSGFGAILLL